MHMHVGVALCVCVCVCVSTIFSNCDSKPFKNVLRSKYLLVAKWLEALSWCFSQPGFGPSYGEILSSHTDEF